MRLLDPLAPVFLILLLACLVGGCTKKPESPEKRLEQIFSEGTEHYRRRAEVEIKQALGNNALENYEHTDTKVFYRDEGGQKYLGSATVFVQFKKVGSKETINLSDNATSVWWESIEVRFEIGGEKDTIYLLVCKDRKFSSKMIYLLEKAPYRKPAQTNQ